MQTSFPTIFNRITFIARLVMNEEAVTLDDIDNRWRDSTLCDGTSISPRMFYRDRERIHELYGMDIRPRKLDTGVFVYYVRNREKMKQDSLLRWTMNTLAMAETLAGFSTLRHRIFLEDYAPDPHLLPKILQAMKTNKKLSITYQRFDNVSAKTHTVEPFFIKDYQHRLYMIARIEGKENPCVFALDRIVSITPLNKSFKMPKDLTAEEFFEDCYGVYRPDDMKTENVILRAYENEMFYLYSKPLHHSQKPLGNLDLSLGSCDFQLYLKPTLDFIGFLLSRAGRIEVRHPLWLRKRIQTAHRISAKRYDVDASAVKAV